MERFTISLEESLAQQFDQLVQQCGYKTGRKPCVICCARS